METLSSIDWILIGGFLLVGYCLQQIHLALRDILSEVQNIESVVSSAGDIEEDPPRL